MAPSTCIHLYGMISLVVLPTRTYVDIAQPLLGALIVAPAITIVEIADATSTKIATWINIVRVASICPAIVMISDARTGNAQVSVIAATMATLCFFLNASLGMTHAIRAWRVVATWRLSIRCRRIK